MASTIQLERVRNGHDISDGDVEAPTKFRSGQPLSGREVQVLRLLAEGKKNAEIARQLFISRQTVKKHVSSIFAKLQADNRVQAAVYAVRNGII
jgi:DNA-binding NarL/FixJ family response regulator